MGKGEGDKEKRVSETGIERGLGRCFMYWLTQLQRLARPKSTGKAGD